MYGLTFPVLSDFVTGFQRDPSAETEDTELRKALYSALYRLFSDANLQFRMPKQGLDIAYYSERDTLALTPVKTAYPVAEKFDIAVLDLAVTRPLESGEADTVQRFQRYWEQPVSVALQLHLCKPEQNPVKYLPKLARDLKGFATYADSQNGEFSGLSLLFVQDNMPEDERLSPATFPETAGTKALVIAENGIFAFN